MLVCAWRRRNGAEAVAIESVVYESSYSVPESTLGRWCIELL